MKKLLFAMTSVFALVSCAAAQDLSDHNGRPNLRSGAVYVMTNQTVNTVLAFARDPRSGRLTMVDEEATGGAGNPIAIPPDPPTDALASQGSLVVDEDNEYIYAVNAGSNEISVLEVGRSGLDFVQKVSSGGTRPISLALHDNLLYVLNEGATPNITGFSVDDDGMLTHIAGSTQPLVGGASADPAQVGFNSDGTMLVVTEKMGNRLDSYDVNSNGVAGPPTAHASSGMTPFGFAFDENQYAYVSEAMGGAPGASALSSYDADEDYDIVTASLGNNQTASCWVALGGSTAFVSNTGSATISSYRFDPDGNLSLLHAVAANTGAGSSPIDITVSRNAHVLYVLESGSHVISAWDIGDRGHDDDSLDDNGNHHSRGLRLIGEFGSLPPGSQGIASK
jgi:6-phosphogluconolactonase